MSLILLFRPSYRFFKAILVQLTPLPPGSPALR